MPHKIKDFSYPFVKLQRWLEAAKLKYQFLKLNNYNAAALSTVSPNGQPSSRIILIKDINKEYLTFYTNLNSKKSQEIRYNSLVSLLFYWEVLKKQVRIEGSVEQITDEEADLYFASRPYFSKLGAWASKQSQVLNSRIELEGRIINFAAKHKLNVPRPSFWSGFKLKPHYFEFWEEFSFRLHNRVSYTKTENGFKKALLYP